MFKKQIQDYFKSALPALFLLLLLVGGTQVSAQRNSQVQKDTVIIESEDTVLMRSYAARFDPRKALLYAAVVPGLGQVYNKKYWKLPLVYGGFFLLGRQVYRLNDQHKEVRIALFANLEAGATEGNDLGPEYVGKYLDGQYRTSTLRRYIQRTRRDRDFFIIMTGLMYVAQIVDAHVDAHLKEFDLNPNLKVTFEPTLSNDAFIGRQAGVGMFIRF